MPRLRLLGREDCGLCEELMHELQAHAGTLPLDLVWQDVDRDAELRRRYGLRVPVLIDEWNEVICEGRFEATAFDQYLFELRRAQNISSKSPPPRAGEG